LQELKQYNVRLLVRTCEKNYDETPITKAGIEVQEFYFKDGTIPTPELISRWLELVDRFFATAGPSNGEGQEKRIGVHCVAGLGRAPFLVAIALIHRGCSPGNAISLIRKNRSGALNQD